MTASSLTATSGTGINLDTTITTVTSANVTGTGAIDIRNSGALTVTSATTNDGAITLAANNGTLTLTTVSAGGTGRNVTASTTTAGDIVVGSVSAAGDQVSLTAVGSITDANGATNNVTASNLIATAGTGIDLDTTVTTLSSASVTGTGAIDIRNSGALTVTSATTNDGAITLAADNGTLTLTSVSAGGTGHDVTASTTTAGNIAVGSVSATGDRVLLTAVGAITDANGATNNVTASSLTATAGTGIDLDTTITTLTSASVTGTGAIDIRNAGALTVTSATTADGSISLAAAGGDLAIAAVSAGGAGDVSLTTTGSGNVVLGSVTASGNNVSVISAGQINDDANDNAADITAATASLTAGSGIGVTNGSVDLSVPSVTLVASGTGGISVNSLGAASFADVHTTGAGTITVTGTGNTSFASVSSNSGDIALSDSTGTLSLAAATAGGAGNVSLTADEINLTGAAGSITGTGTITLRSQSANQNIELGGSGATAALDLTTAEIGTLANGFSAITIGRAADGTGTVTLAADVIFNDNVTLVGGSIASNAKLTSAGNAVTLTARTGGITDGNAALANVVASSLTASAVTGIDLDTTITTLTSANVSGTGAIDIRNSGALTVTNATTNDGAITFAADNGTLTLAAVSAGGTGRNVTASTTTAGNIAVGSVSATGDQVSLTAAGAITDANGATNNVTAASLTATASTGIDLDTTITTLTSANVTGTGAIDVSNSGALAVTSATTNDGAITLNATGGNLAIQSVAANGTGRDILLSTTTSGDVVFNPAGFARAAGDTVSIAAAGKIVGNATDTGNFLGGNLTTPNVVANRLVISAPGGVGDDPATTAAATPQNPIDARSEALVTQVNELALTTSNSNARVYNIGATQLNLDGGATTGYAVNTGTGNFALFSTGAVTQTNPLKTNALTVVTLNNSGAAITLDNADNDAQSFSLFACLAMPGGCPDPGPGAGAASPAFSGNTTGVNYASGALLYKDTNGATLTGIGTISAFSTFTPGNYVLTGTINAGSVTIGAGGDIDVNLASNLTKINNLGTGAFSLVAGGDIRFNHQSGSTSFGSIGAAATNSSPAILFNHDLFFSAGGSILLENSIYQASKNLALAAGGNVTMQGNQTIRTGGNVAISGVNVTIGGTAQVNDFGTTSTAAALKQNANGQELTATGTIDFLNTGVITVRAGTATGSVGGSAGDTPDTTSAGGTRVTAGTINIGTPGSRPTQLLIQGGSNSLGLVTSNPNNADIELRQADAVVESLGTMTVFLGSGSSTPAGAFAEPFGKQYSLVIKGGDATANSNGGAIRFVTALGALRAHDMTLTADGSILLEGGTSTLNATSSFIASSAVLLVETAKSLTTTGGGSVIIKGGHTIVNPSLTSVSARNAVALGELDPSTLDMTVDGHVLLVGGVTSGPAGSLASARIDAGDEIKITVNGAPTTYAYTDSLGAPRTVTGQFFMIGGSGSGLFDANNLSVSGAAKPITINVPVTFGPDTGLGDSIVQTGLSTFNNSLLSYIIFAANEETRAARFRKGLGDSDDVGAPACK